MSLTLTEPVNRTILLLDIESFSKRDDVEQAFLRRGLHSVVEDVLAEAGVEPDRQYREDRGDGLIILVSADIPKTALLRALLTTAPDALRDYNRVAASSAQMRLRTVLASGEVARDPREGTVGGLVGHDLNQACRLLDADVLREALKQRATDCVLCVSTPVYEGVVRHGHRGLRPEEFHRVDVAVKTDRLEAWLHGPLPQRASAAAAASCDGGSDSPAGGTADASIARNRVTEGGGTNITVHGGSLTFGGSQVNGDQIGVSGGNVTGDVVMGSVQRGEQGGR
ncbi:hypothetical protein [Actinacidiphila yeochonensis]|uniref:hypothetical protein n=1 Tax=Actinacidiphila yeochonensis TaxID=89050 RepID=UPI0007C6414E|nr:hypothetical protein [Actinacidiphila yeochonensis]